VYLPPYPPHSTAVQSHEEKKRDRSLDAIMPPLPCWRPCQKPSITATSPDHRCMGLAATKVASAHNLFTTQVVEHLNVVLRHGPYNTMTGELLRGTLSSGCQAPCLPTLLSSIPSWSQPACGRISGEKPMIPQSGLKPKPQNSPTTRK
jgi:hypothetical protein